MPHKKHNPAKAVALQLPEENPNQMMAQLNINAVRNITIGAEIDGTDFDATLDTKYRKFFNEFRGKFMISKCKSAGYLKRELVKILSSHDNPLLLALKLYANCADNNDVKPKTLSLFVLETVCKLQSDNAELSDECDDNLSMISFNLVKFTGLVTLNNAMIRTYRIRQIREILMPKLREMLDGGYYKEVSQWSISLKMTAKFDILDVVFPLFAMEQLSLVEDYLDEASDQRLPFVKFIDSLLHKDKPVIELCEPYFKRYNHLKISFNFLNYRPVSKTITRYVKKYGYDETATPKLKFTKTCSYLHFLYREYEKSRSNLDSYRELVRLHATEYALQVEFVYYLTGSNQLEALYWYNEFKLLEKDCPHMLKKLISNSKKQVQVAAKPTPTEQQQEENQPAAEGGDEYLSIDLPDDSIIIVDKVDLFEKMVEHLQCEPRIYLDSEWMQYVCQENQLCLIQIATVDNVYLIDCLVDCFKVEHWHNLGETVFNNTSILKVGFSLYNDLTVMQRSLPLEMRLHEHYQFLDLRTAWLELKKQRIGVALDFPFGIVHRMTGDALSDLSMICLGKKLDKTNQCSNWANRPLRRDQVVYAALDARCLLHIYNCLTSCVPDIERVFDRAIACNNFARR